MRISERYRVLYENVANQLASLEQVDDEDLSDAVKSVRYGAEELAGCLETVGEIPQIKLEQRLSPVLIHAHSKLDRARVLLESAEMKQAAANIWELEQQIYRLLNDL